MSDSDKLRDGATRLLALALNAREQGFSSANELADLANEALAQADEMDMRDRASVRPPVQEAPTQQFLDRLFVVGVLSFNFDRQCGQPCIGLGRPRQSKFAPRFRNFSRISWYANGPYLKDRHLPVRSALAVERRSIVAFCCNFIGM